MPAFKRMFALAVVSLASVSAAQYSDQVVAAGVLGPRWKQISRSAGMIFSGTVLEVETRPATKDRPLPLVLVKFRVDRAIAGVRSGQLLTVREWAGAWSTHRAIRSGERMLIFFYPPSRLGLTSPVGGLFGQVPLDSRGEVVVSLTQGPGGLSPRKDSSSGLHRTSAAEAGVDSAGLVARLKSCPPENHSVEAYSKAVESCRSQDASVGGTLPEPVSRCATQNPTFPAHCLSATQPSITLLQLERAIRSARRN
jgi:hypothetical protein